MKSNEWTVKQAVNDNGHSDSFYESKNGIILYINKEHKGEEENDNSVQARQDRV